MNCSSAMAFPSVSPACARLSWLCSDKNAAHQIGPEQTIRREHGDQALAVIEAADRGDFRVALAAREQCRRRIDGVGIDVKDFPGAIGNDTDGALAHREHDNLAGFVAFAVGGRPSSARNETSGSRRSRNVTTPSTAVSDARHFRNMRPATG